MLAAFHLATDALPEFSSKFSRRDFTRPQLFACLVLKEFEKKDYRGIEQLLWDCPALRRSIGLAKAPDHTTLHRASKALLALPRAQKMLDKLVVFARAWKVLGKKVALAALDSSGYEARHISSYFVRRRTSGGIAKGAAKTQEITYNRFPKLAIVVDCATHLILSFWTGIGPGPDHGHGRLSLSRLATGRCGQAGCRRGIRLGACPRTGPLGHGDQNINPAPERPAASGRPATRWSLAPGHEHPARHQTATTKKRIHAAMAK